MNTERYMGQGPAMEESCSHHGGQKYTEKGETREAHTHIQPCPLSPISLNQTPPTNSKYSTPIIQSSSKIPIYEHM